MVNSFLANVRKYDATADAAAVDKIVKHLGIALRSRDSAYVACSDPAELARVRKSWCAKKLGESNPEKCESAVAHVCETMSHDEAKSRVTFYYLVAKHLDRLSVV